jgi:HEAT repeat protein
MDIQTGTDSAAERAKIDALVELAEADDPAQRVQVLSALGDRGGADDDTVRSTLEAALADRDASVRGQALKALAVRGGSEAMEHLRQGLRDSDPGVRIMALERVEPRDDGIALLEEALADADETVRSFAAARLKQAENHGDTE